MDPAVPEARAAPGGCCGDSVSAVLTDRAGRTGGTGRSGRAGRSGPIRLNVPMPVLNALNMPIASAK